MHNEYEYDNELTFADYLMDKEVLTLDEFKSDAFRYFFYESYYNGYKDFCKDNNIYYEKIIF